MATHNEWTGGQAAQILRLIEEKDSPRDQIQKILSTGLLSDLLVGNIDQVDRDKFREVLGLRQTNPMVPIWKTLEIGTGLKTAEDFRSKLNRAGFRISRSALSLMSCPGFRVSETQLEVDLVIRSSADLGFGINSTWDEIYARAENLGLDVCPPEVGPQLRLAHSEQPNKTRLLIAMKPIIDHAGYQRAFVITSYNGIRGLDDVSSRHCGVSDDHLWVLRVPR